MVNYSTDRGSYHADFRSWPDEHRLEAAGRYAFELLRLVDAPPALYELALVAFELFDGRHPFEAHTPKEWAILNAAGATRWTRGYAGSGSTSNSASSVTIGPAGILVSGGFSQSIDLGGGALDGYSGVGSGFVVSLGSDGSYGWAQRFGSYVGRLFVRADAAGDVSITGTCRDQGLITTTTPCLQTDIGTILSRRDTPFLLRLRP